MDLILITFTCLISPQIRCTYIHDPRVQGTVEYRLWLPMATSKTNAQFIVDPLAAHFESAIQEENPFIPQSIWQHCRPSLCGGSLIINTSPGDFRSRGPDIEPYVHMVPTKESVDLSFFCVSTFVAPRTYSFSYAWNVEVVDVLVFLVGIVFLVVILFLVVIVFLAELRGEF